MIIQKLPSWFRQDIPNETTIARISQFSESRVNTVCQQAKCPNLSYCFRKSKLTFLILGDLCSRNCRFCAVKKSDTKLTDCDVDEPYRVAKLAQELGLTYVVITSVTRDDLEDGGAVSFTRTIELIRQFNKEIKIEALIPDFKGNTASLNRIISASPDVVGHNIETVKRLYGQLRPEADYQRSLAVLNYIKESCPNLATKSSLMLGLGEQEAEVIQAMEDLKDSRCDILTLGQYLAPSKQHYPVKEFIGPEQFMQYEEIGLGLGFKAVLSGPLVRSSYKAEEVYREAAYV